MNELQIRKRELELRLSVYLANEISRFVQDTGIRVVGVDVPLQEVYELGSMNPHHLLSVEVELESVTA